MTKELSHVKLELHNIWIKLSNVKKKRKVREPPNVTKELSHVILELHNVRMELSNVRKKKVREPSNVRKTVTCDIGIVQCENRTVKCGEKVREPPNVRKELSHVMLELHNVRIESSNMRKKK